MNASSILRGRRFGFTLLTLVVLTFLGHIASLPSSAHAPFSAPAGTHEPSEGHSGASHVASCDAAVSRPAPSASCPGDDAPWMVGPVIGVALPHSAARIPATGRQGRVDADPPLFLLHASFLI